MLELPFSFKLDWGSYIISIAKTASKTSGALIRSVKFLSPEAALYLDKFTIQSCIKYYCHVWAGAPSCYWNCWISYKGTYAELLVLQLVSLLNFWFITKM